MYVTMLTRKTVVVRGYNEGGVLFYYYQLIIMVINTPTTAVKKSHRQSLQ